MKSCAIVILNYNGEKTLKTFLPSVVQYSCFDIWIVDNDSSDGSISFVKKDFPQIQFLQATKNLGFAEGYNWGLEQLAGQYDTYILLNSDVEVTAGWDYDLVAKLIAKPDFAAFQPKILSWKDRSQFDYAGAGGGFMDEFGYPYCRGRIWDSIETDTGQYDDDIQVDWTSGACMAVKADIFHKMGGFDADFFAHMEEIDLCWRMRKRGWKMGYTGAVKVYHLGGATLDRASARKLYLNIRNSLSMVYKNSDNFTIIYSVKYLLENLAAVRFWINGEKDFAKAIWKGYSDFRGKKQKILKIESLENEIQSSSPVQLVFWNWKILGKKSYLEL